MAPVTILLLVVIILGSVAAGLIILGLRERDEVDPLEARLAEFAERGEITDLHDIEMSQTFSERVILPLADQLGGIALRFTPQKALDEIEHKLEMAGNPRGIKPTTYFASRFIVAGVIFVMFIFIYGGELFSIKNLATTLGLTALGFVIPNLMLGSTISRRQTEIRKALPDALDLLTICVEAGLGFDAAMKKVSEKWDNELSIAFGRALKELQLGKLRREALRNMADRIGAGEMDSFVSAVIQSEQLGVSMAKILRIQSDDMRVRRRQRAEQEAQKAPIKMLVPMTLLIFPTIFVILMGPAAIQLMGGALGAMF